MLNVFTLFLFLIISSSGFSAKLKIKKFSSAGIRRVYNEIKVTEKNHFKVAENLENFREKYWKFKDNKSRLKKIHLLKKETKKIKIFHPFYQWLNFLEDLQGSEGSLGIIKNCEKISFNHFILEENTRDICHEFFLFRLGEEIKGKGFLKPEHISYFKRNFTPISQMKIQLRRFLQKSSRNASVFPILKTELRKLYLSEEKKPGKRIGKLIGIKAEKKTKRHKKRKPKKPYSRFRENISKVIALVDKERTERDIFVQTKSLVVDYFKKKKKSLPINDSYERVLKLAEYFTRRQKFKVARYLLDFISFRTRDFDQDIHFAHLWSYILQGNKRRAFTYIKLNKLDRKYEESSSKVNFWTAYILNQNHNEKRSRLIFSHIIKENPLSYYAIISAKELNGALERKKVSIKNHPYHLSLNNPENKFMIQPKKLPKNVREAFQRLQVFAPLKNSPLMYDELKEIIESIPLIQKNTPHLKLSQIRTDIYLITAHILHKHEQYLETFKLVYKGINNKYLSFTPQVIKMLFPKPYFTEVKKRLDKDIDPVIVLSLMRQESSFNPAARSPVGARGLMQLMPSTARKLKKRVKRKQLHDPKINIELGTKYVKQLMKKYEDNIVFTLAAYNAGASRVRYWREHYFNEKSMLKDIENIPFEETRNYVKLIYRNIFLYKFINGTESVRDFTSPNKIFDISMNYPHGS